MNIQLIIEVLGTIAFAISGAMLAVERKMDLFGVLFLGLVTASGGGFMRDVALGIVPPSMFVSPMVIPVGLLASFYTFLAIHWNQHMIPYLPEGMFQWILNFTDAVGLGLFTVLGVNVAIEAGYGECHKFVLFLGMLTGVGGGMLRDIFAGLTPAILRKHIYACASLFGAACYDCLLLCIRKEYAMFAGAVTVTAIRMLAYHLNGICRGQCNARRFMRKKEEENLKKILDLIAGEMEKAFRTAGYNPEYAGVTLSNRPDLCEYQCNGALAAAKEYHKAPIMIADSVVEALKSSELFEDVQSVKPGFINLKVRADFLSGYLNGMYKDSRLGYDKAGQPKTIMIDYGGPNVAKPLHVGHLRSAIIGESVKRIARFAGHKVIGDVHLGDWGLQMGLIIMELKNREPKLPYFDEAYEGAYPEEAPFTIAELEEIYPTASAKSKEDAAYKEAAMQATFELQQGRKGYQALLQHILKVSVTDLKRNYENLKVEFDLWKGESDAQPYIPDMVQRMKDQGFAHMSEGALVVDVKEETDTKEVPPCMLLKSDGASLYTTTDLATIVERMKLYRPDEIIYVVDKRQEMHFVQVFRCAKKCGLVGEDTAFKFLGFGTMNGKDGKPFKTREGGVMRLEYLLKDINEEMLKKIRESRPMSEEEAREIAGVVGLSAVKYGDLSNQASKDYIFDVDRFTSSEGNTGPYILYTIVRIKSILKKYEEQGGRGDGAEIAAYGNESEKALMLELTRFNSVMETAYEELAPHKVCAYIYDLANAFNKFYHETSILGTEEEAQKNSRIRLLVLTRRVLEACIDVLGFEAPERM